MEIIAESEYRYVIPWHGRMLVPGVVFASRALIADPAGDRALEQVVNVAELPGIVTASYAMPGVHWGYGFPIGRDQGPKRQQALGPYTGPRTVPEPAAQQAR